MSGDDSGMKRECFGCGREEVGRGCGVGFFAYFCGWRRGSREGRGDWYEVFDVVGFNWMYDD